MTYRTSSLFIGPPSLAQGLVFQQHRFSDHLNKPHDPFKTVGIGKPQGLIQFEINGLLLAFFNGNIRRVKVHAIYGCQGSDLVARPNRANALFFP